MASLSAPCSRGALASEYYSLSRTVRSRKLRRKLLDEALRLVDEALEEPGRDPSGLRSIKGSVLVAEGRLTEGVSEYEAALEARRSEDPGRVGDVESKLGWGYFRLWLTWRVVFWSYLRKARHYMEHGAELLERSDQRGFTVRALKTLGAFYVLTFHPSRARQVLERAHDLAVTLKLHDQLRQILPPLRLLRKITRLDKRGLPDRNRTE